jgi:hypothetical protein
VLETEDESVVLMDYAIHDIRHDGLNLIDVILRDEPPEEGSVALRLLRSLQQARFVLSTVTDVEPGLGVYGDASHIDEPCFLADVGFSKTAVPDLLIASRLHAPSDGWYMTTGSPLPVDAPTGAAIMAEVKAYVGEQASDPRRLIFRRL